MTQLWAMQYRTEAIPGKTFIKDQLKVSDGFVQYHSKGLKMAPGRNVKTSSGYEIDLSKTGVYTEIFDATEYQWNKIKASSPQTGVFDTTEEEELKFVEPPVTPVKKISENQESAEISDLHNTILPDE
jgi:hypothetical protein